MLGLHSRITKADYLLLVPGNLHLNNICKKFLGIQVSKNISLIELMVYPNLNLTASHPRSTEDITQSQAVWAMPLKRCFKRKKERHWRLFVYLAGTLGYFNRILILNHGYLYLLSLHYFRTRFSFVDMTKEVSSYPSLIQANSMVRCMRKEEYLV